VAGGDRVGDAIVELPARPFGHARPGTDAGPPASWSACRRRDRSMAAGKGVSWSSRTWDESQGVRGAAGW
jgi:hypothetical protein